MRKAWVENQIGNRFGKLLVTGVCMSNGRVAGRVVCDCGERRIVESSNLRRGMTRSCGCGIPAAISRKLTTHGHSGKPEFCAWANMIRRCTQPKNPAWKHYGGRGIKVCARWLKFENFLADIGARPSKLHSLDRFPNNNGHYEPGNCRWATQKQQMNNTRACHRIEFAGHSRTLAEWARVTGITEWALSNRIRRGWPLERALTQAVSRRIQQRRAA